MITRCPSCGSQNSLDTLINNAEAAELMVLALGLDKELGKAVIKYLGLFRPAKSSLSFGRSLTLLKELMPDIEAGQIKRDGIVYQAPVDAWVYGLQTVIAARDANRLKTPLKSHGYLYEVIAGWQGSVQQIDGLVQKNSPTVQQMGKASQTLNAAAQLEGMKR